MKNSVKLYVLDACWKDLKFQKSELKTQKPNLDTKFKKKVFFYWAVFFLELQNLELNLFLQLFFMFSVVCFGKSGDWTAPELIMKCVDLR